MIIRPVRNSGARHVTLFVPELLSGLCFVKDMPQQDVPKLPAIQLLLSRATQQQDDYDDFYQGVCVLSGIAEKTNQDIPAAAITVASEKQLTAQNNSEFYIFAEPVVMKPDRDSVVLLKSLKPNSFISGSDPDCLTFDESEQLISDINKHFVDEPWVLYQTQKSAWYFSLESRTSIRTSNITKVLLKHTQTYLPKGDDAGYWRKIVNEIEMLLFSSKVNAKRVEQNKITVTSLWLWGGGRIPDLNNSNKKNDIILGADDFLKSISHFVNIPFKSLAQQSITELISMYNFKYFVIVNTILKSHWQQRDLYSWFDALEKINAGLFEPLLKSLGKGDIDSLCLHLDEKNKLKITRRNAKRWWRPVKSLEKLSNLL